MTALDHVGDNAALYALGVLGEDERSRVDEHVRDCTQCERLLGSAEDDVAIIAAAQVSSNAPAGLSDRIEATLGGRPRRKSNALWPFAMAAALVVGLLPSAYFWQEGRAMREAVVAESAAVDRMTANPHRTVPFHGLGPGAASVTYAPDGSWYVVVVRNASHPMHVVWMHDGEKTPLGAAMPHGDVATLYLPKSHRMDTLAIVDGSVVVAEAQLTYD